MNHIFNTELKARQKLASTMLASAINQDKLANAYLLTGRNIEDKWQLANTIACYLNCNERKAGNDFCSAPSSCQNCIWISKEEHPQAWIKLKGEGASGKIQVEKVRLLQEELAKTAQSSRIVVIEDANQFVFHRPAANALLKTIEEPPKNCIFFLFANSANEVLPTIVSRCQLIPIMQTAQTEGLHKNANDLIERTINFKSSSYTEVLDWIQQIIAMEQEISDGQLVIDCLVSKEFDRLKDQAVLDGQYALYLKRLIGLAENSKQQIDSFVQPKFALEAFVISWRQLGLDFALA